MKQQIIRSLISRYDEIAPQSPLMYLKSCEISDYFDTIISVVYLYTRPKKGAKDQIFFTEVACAVGHQLRAKMRLKKDSSIAVKTGAFVLYSFELMKLLKMQMVKGPSGHGTYVVTVLNDDALSDMWNRVILEKSEKLPSEKPYAPWVSSRHETGASLVKTGNRDVLAALNPESHPIVFDCVNKAQQVGWNINKQIYSIYGWAFKNKTDAFAEIWELSNAEAKTTKIREAKAIGDIAKRMLNKTFYH